MTISYSNARRRLATVLDEVLDSREAITITRRGKEDVAVLPASELRALEETAYLLRSPANAARLGAALERARAGHGPSQSVEAVRDEAGLG